MARLAAVLRKVGNRKACPVRTDQSSTPPQDTDSAKLEASATSANVLTTRVREVRHGRSAPPQSGAEGDLRLPAGPSREGAARVRPSLEGPRGAKNFEPSLEKLEIGESARFITVEERKTRQKSTPKFCLCSPQGSRPPVLSTGKGLHRQSCPSEIAAV